MGERVCVIVNPKAGRGRGARMIPEIAARFAEVGVAEIRSTQSQGDEIAISKKAIADGFTTLIAVGGDGTSSNVANSILHSGEDVRLGVLPAGTGNDFAKVLGTLKSDVSSLARLASEPSSRRVDVGRVEDNFFLNCCGFGFDVAVLEEIGRTPWLRGNSVYLYTALQQLFGFRGIDVGVSSQGAQRSRQRQMLVVVANAAYFGGTFLIAPGASVTDGKLDAVVIADLPPARRIRVLAAATRGTHGRYRECTTHRASAFRLSFAQTPLYETDGELHHAQSDVLSVSCLPSALRVVAGPGFQS